MNIQDSKIQDILSANKKIAVYGLSPDPSKPSHDVPLFMRSKGYNLVGVYPKIHTVNGFQIYTQLADVPLEYRKFVNVFRASEKIPEVVDELLKIGGTEILWLQLGIANPEAEKRAENAGLTVISNRCLYIEYMKWIA